MSGIQLYHNETIFSVPFLRRLQIPTDKAIDSCCTAIIQLFTDRYGDKIGELLKLGETELDKVDQFLTVKITNEELGVSSGKNPSRAIDYLRSYLTTICERPYIIYETVQGGIRKYHELPLLKYHDVDEKGNCTLIYNDALRYHVSPRLTPDIRYGCCSIVVLKEIKARNTYAGVLYEEACSWVNFGNGGKNPFFDWSVKELRQKFTFDIMSDFNEDMTKFEVATIKKMRIDVIRNKVLKPALEVLEDFYSNGIITFWLEMRTYLMGKKKVGRPPKNSFHFIIHKEKKVVEPSDPQSSHEPDIKYDDYEAITILSEIKTELDVFVRTDKLKDLITSQIEKREQENPEYPKMVLHKIRDMKSRIPDREYIKGDEVLTALWDDCNHLGREPKSRKRKLKYDVPHWTDMTTEQKINYMQNSQELLDEASKIGLSPDQAKAILAGDFFNYCIKNQKPLYSWDDACSLFYRWQRKIITSNNNNKIYGAKGETTSNEGWNAAFDFLSEPSND